MTAGKRRGPRCPNPSRTPSWDVGDSSEARPRTLAGLEVGTWQKDDMRRISAWAALFAVPTMVAGIYGMNFAHMPEPDWRCGCPCVFAVMALGAGPLYREFRRNGWL